jgi:hypothetical protein
MDLIAIAARDFTLPQSHADCTLNLDIRKKPGPKKPII